MKKAYALLLGTFMAATMILSCAKEPEKKEEAPAREKPAQEETVENTVLELTATIVRTKVATADNGEGSTPAWEAGDTIFGWWTKSTLGAECIYVVQSVDGGGKATLKLNSGSDPIDGATLHSIYAPAYGAGDFTDGHSLRVSFEGQDGSLDGLGDFSYMCASVTMSGKSANLAFSQQTAIIGLETEKFSFPSKALNIVSYSITGRRICSTATFSHAGDDWEFTCGPAGEISLEAGGAAEKLFIRIPKTSAPTDITITALDAAGRHYTASLGQDITVEAGDCIMSGSLTFERDPAEAKRISILAIGNSFSIDAMEYLYPMLKQAGFEEIALGNLYIGGCALATHANNLANDSASYEYYTNTSGTWNKTGSYKASKALKSRSWDYVCMQQVSNYSGMAETFEPYLSAISAKVSELCPGAEKMWHMTWAYQSGSTHAAFPNYGSDQMTMYEAIVSAVKGSIIPRNDISFVIPCGTAVQNLRTSFIGDNITRDGYHMSYNIGRFVTAMMWAKQITGCNLQDISYRPSAYTYTDDEVAAIKEAVQNAYDKPFEVTPSTYTSNLKEVGEPNAELRAILEAKGYDPSKYIEVDCAWTQYAYYNSTAGSALTSKAGGSTASNIDQFTATRMFQKGDLVDGTIIVLKDGYQYRPEGWTSLSSRNNSSTRPANTSTQLTVVDGKWWGSWNIRAFNISMVSVSHMTAAQMQEATKAFGIFIPRQAEAAGADLTTK